MISKYLVNVFSIEDWWTWSEICKYAWRHWIQHKRVVMGKSKRRSKSHKSWWGFWKRTRRCRLSPVVVVSWWRGYNFLRFPMVAVDIRVIFFLYFGLWLWKIKRYLLSNRVGPQWGRTGLRTWLSHPWWRMWRYPVRWWWSLRWFWMSLGFYGNRWWTFGRHMGRCYGRWNCNEKPK